MHVKAELLVCQRVKVPLSPDVFVEEWCVPKQSGEKTCFVYSGHSHAIHEVRLYTRQVATTRARTYLVPGILILLIISILIRRSSPYRSPYSSTPYSMYPAVPCTSTASNALPGNYCCTAVQQYMETSDEATEFVTTATKPTPLVFKGYTYDVTKPQAINSFRLPSTRNTPCLGNGLIGAGCYLIYTAVYTCLPCYLPPVVPSCCCVSVCLFRSTPVLLPKVIQKQFSSTSGIQI